MAGIIIAPSALPATTPGMVAADPDGAVALRTPAGGLAPPAGGGSPVWLAALDVAAPVYFSNAAPTWADRTMHIYNGSTADQNIVLPTLTGKADGYTIGIMAAQSASANFNLVRLSCAGADTFQSYGNVWYLFPGEMILLRKVDFLGASVWQIVAFSGQNGAWQDAVLSWNGSSVSPTKGATRPTDRYKWRRNGWGIDVKFWYEQTSAGTAGAGTYRMVIPGSAYLATDYPGVAAATRGEGSAILRAGATTVQMFPFLQTASSGFIAFRKATDNNNWSASDSGLTFAATSLFVEGQYTIPFKKSA